MSPNRFEQAAQRHRAGMVSELWHFLANNKKWWMLPLLVLMLLFGLLVMLSGSAAAPFIYTLF